MKLRTWTVFFLALNLLISPRAWAQQKAEPPPVGQPPQVEPKFVWGLLINFAIGQLASVALSPFKEWLAKKLISSLGDGIAAGAVRLMARDSGARIVDARSAGVLSKDAVNTISQAPTEPLKVENGKENFQAAQISIGVADPDGKLTFRPLSRGFRSGERIKLHVISTFNGVLMVENINPKNERKKIYPVTDAQMVELQAGKETLIPLGEDQYFEFTKTTGEEQLLITLRDPRAEGAAKSAAKVNRSDERYGSQFMQEVSPSTYPSMTEAIKLVHY